MDDGADHFVPGQADVEAGVDVQLELRLSGDGGQPGDGHQRLLVLVERRAGVDVAERELDDEVRQVRRQVLVELDQLRMRRDVRAVLGWYASILSKARWNRSVAMSAPQGLALTIPPAPGGRALGAEPDVGCGR